MSALERLNNCLAEYQNKHNDDNGVPRFEPKPQDVRQIIKERKLLLSALVTVLNAHDYDGALTTGSASLSPAIHSMVKRTLLETTEVES